jgi:hypothetical protein
MTSFAKAISDDARQLERELAERTEEYEETRELLGKELERKARWMKLADERAIEVADLKVQLARPSAEREHVAWCRYVHIDGDPTRIVCCNSDDQGAFKVYRS